MRFFTGVATGFERRFLFGVGRHCWNFLAVVGVGLMATGGIMKLISLPSSGITDQEKRDFVCKYPNYYSSSGPLHKESTNAFTCYTYDFHKKFGKFDKTGFVQSRFLPPRKVTGPEYRALVEESLNEIREQYNAVHYWNVKLENQSKSSPLIAASGLGIFAVASLVSVAFSIERNTRKD